MRKRGTKRESCGPAALAAAWCAALALALACLGVPGCAPEPEPEPDAAASASDAEGDGAPEGDPSGLVDVGDVAPPEGQEPEGTALAARIDAYLDRNFPATGVPGVAVAVVDGQDVRYLRTLGDVPGPDAPFVIGSLSKSFTALAVMQLVEEGAIDLDAPASAYAPAYDVPAAVTVRDLLNQTSGFGYYESLADARAGDAFGEFSYANANYDLLGRIVEAVSGQSYADYLDGRVLGPLDMATSSADPARAAAFGMAPGHRAWFGVPVADGFVHGSSDETWGAAPSGYVASSVEDMARYLQMYLNGGVGANGARVLSPEGVASMFLDRVPDPEGDTYYGMGWTSFCWDDGELVLSHDGQVENYVASMCLLPERDLGVVVLGNASDHAGGDSLFFDMASGVVAAAVGADPEPVDAAWVWRAHQRDDVLYLSVSLACALPIVTLPRWAARRGDGSASRSFGGRGRSARVVRAVLLHVVAPLGLLALPFAWGVPWRDLLAFAPDVSAVLLVCAALLVVAGVAKLMLVAKGSRDDGSRNGPAVKNTHAV